LQASSLDAAFAVVAIVVPSHILVRPEILLTQPLLEGGKVFPQGGAIQATLSQGFLKDLLPGLGGALRHEGSVERKLCGLLYKALIITNVKI